MPAPPQPDPDPHALLNLLTASGLGLDVVATRCGYRNLEKGRQRLITLVVGDLTLFRYLRRRLARALGIGVERLDAAAEAVRRHRAAMAPQETTPHITWTTELDQPSDPFQAALSEAATQRHFQPHDTRPLRMLAQAIALCPDKLYFYGKVTGFVIHYGPGCRTAFDRRGNPLPATPAAASGRDGARLAARPGRPPR